MTYAVEMSSGALTYIPSFITIGSGIQKLIEEVSQKHRQHGDLISLFILFENKKSRLTRSSSGLPLRNITSRT
jgi:hypothetical protein